MLATTTQIIRSALQADPSLNPHDRAQVLALLREKPGNSKTADVPRLIRRAEAARRLSCSLRLVDRLAKDGFLAKRKLPGRQRASGFLESDVERLILTVETRAQAA